MSLQAETRLWTTFSVPTNPHKRSKLESILNLSISSSIFSAHRTFQPRLNVLDEIELFMHLLHPCFSAFIGVCSSPSSKKVPAFGQLTVSTFFYKHAVMEATFSLKGSGRTCFSSAATVESASDSQFCNATFCKGSVNARVSANPSW